MDEIISDGALIECLKRSGYLMESRIVKKMEEMGFFIDSNQVVKDKLTGKSREIDIVAEYFVYSKERAGTHVRTYFVMEIINNKYPFVLTTEKPYSPNTDAWEMLKYITTPKDTLREIELPTSPHLQ